MKISAHNLSIVFAAGALGGLTNGIAVWGAGQTGLTAAMGLHIAPAWSPAWLYPRLVWGGLWGALFLLPVMKNSIFKRGILFSLGPTLGVLLIVFPLKAKKGMFGLELGTLTPLFAFVVNAVWGITAAWWVTRER